MRRAAGVVVWLPASCLGGGPVTYQLTGLGLSLHHLMRGIKQWAETHMNQVLANREEYDTRVA